jgi:hypothetical protein
MDKQVFNSKINNYEANCEKRINSKGEKSLTSKNTKLKEICIGRMVVAKMLNLHSSTSM